MKSYKVMMNGRHIGSVAFDYAPSHLDAIAPKLDSPDPNNLYRMWFEYSLQTDSYNFIGFGDYGTSPSRMKDSKTISIKTFDSDNEWNWRQTKA